MLGGGRFLLKPTESLPKVLGSQGSVRFCKTSKKLEKKPTSFKDIVIPPRIERGPTDILKALAATVGKDTTAYHYKYPDDPYFYPYSLFEHQSFALAKESGKRAARWIVDNNPKFFKNVMSDPPVEAFMPKPATEAELEPSEESLLQLIEERNVEKAISMYETLKSQSKDVSNSTKQNLLELVCFFNCKNAPKETEEEFWIYCRGFSTDKDDMNYWEKDNFADKLYSEMDQGCPLANAALLQGYLKYNNLDAANELFEAAYVKKIPMPVGVYNEMLAKTVKMCKTPDKLPSLIMGVLQKMSENKVVPDLGTLNAALQSLARSDAFYGKHTFAENIMTEFKNLGVTPSLGTYWAFLQIASFRFGHNDEVADEIMTAIENEVFDFCHPTDFNFFPLTMKIFSKCSPEANFPQRLHNMLLRNNNVKFLVSSEAEGVYYNNFFIHIFSTEPFDTAMKFFQRYVFTQCTPSSRLFQKIIKTLCENPSAEYFRIIWENVQKMRLSDQRPTLRALVSVVQTHNDEASLQILHTIVKNFLGKSLHSHEPINEDSNTMSCIFIILAKNKDEESIAKVLENCGSGEMFLELSEEAIKLPFELAVNNNNISLAKSFLKLACSQNMPCARELGEKLMPMLSKYDADIVKHLLSEVKEENVPRKSEPDEDEALNKKPQKKNRRRPRELQKSSEDDGIST